MLVKKSLLFQWQKVAENSFPDTIILPYNDTVDNFQLFAETLSSKEYEVQYVVIDEVHSFNKQLLQEKSSELQK